MEMKSRRVHVAATPKDDRGLDEIRNNPSACSRASLISTKTCHPEVNQEQQVLKQRHKNSGKAQELCSPFLKKYLIIKL